MSEIRQVRVDGINYDLVITEDEPSATRAEQAAQQAANSATQASTYATTAGDRAVAASGFAQDAEDAADRAEAIVGGEFVSYGQDQGLSEDEKLQARANIGVSEGYSPNILENWYFVNPVNSRGQTSYAANGYGVDRWICYSGTQTLSSSGITVPANGVMTQPQNLSELDGKTLTMSVLYSTGLETGTAVLDLSGTTLFINGVDGQAYITSAGLVQFYKTVEYTVKAVKLEIGEASTLASDPPPDLGEELTRCIYSTADPTDTYANTGFGKSNPNLLRNWDFTNPVNSRTKTMYAPNEYAIDGWKIWGDLYARVDSGYIALAQGGSGGGIFQYLEGSVIPILNGKTVTYSAIINDTLYSATGTFVQGAWIAATTDITGVSIVLIFPVEYPAEPISASIRLESTTSVTINVKSVKVEVGTHSTLLNTPPQVYAEELAKCIYSKAWADDPYANTGFGRSNDNLLDNWYFVGGGSQLGDGVFPINQRGLTYYENIGNYFDRWKSNSPWASPIKCALQSEGVVLAGDVTPSYPTAYTQLSQVLESPPVGKTVTLSILTDSVTPDSEGDPPCLYTNDSDWTPITVGLTSVTFVWASGVTQIGIILPDGVTSAASLRMQAIKLELGTVSTLANDAPPKFGGELRECKRYLRYVSLKRLPVFCDANYLVAMTTLEGIEMRATPTPTLVSAGYIFNPATSAISVPTAVSILAFEYNTATIQLSIPASFNGFCMAVDGAICLSAEL